MAELDDLMLNEELVLDSREYLKVVRLWTLGPWCTLMYFKWYDNSYYWWNTSDITQICTSRLSKVHKKTFTLNIEQINLILTDTVLYMYIALMLLNKHCMFYIIIFYS